MKRTLLTTALIATLGMAAPAIAQDATKASAKAVVATLSKTPLSSLCFKGEDGVRKEVVAAYDATASTQKLADKATVVTFVGDTMVATCISSFVGRDGAAYPIF